MNRTTLVSNLTTSSPNTNGNVKDESGSSSEWLVTLQYTIFAAIFVVSVFGNTLVCLVIARTPRMRTTRNYLLVNLAVADLTVALLCIPFEVVIKLSFPHWLLGPVMCKLLWPTMTSVTTCSSVTLVAISYDRYRAVVYPWRPRFTAQQTAIIIGITWSVSFALVIPYLLVLEMKDGYCREVWPSDAARAAYTLGLFITQFIIPMTIIALAYSKVVLKLRNQALRFARKADVSKNPSTLTVPSSSLLAPELPSDFPSVSESPDVERKSTIVPSQSRLTFSPRSPSAVPRKMMQRLERNTKIVKMLVAVVLLYAICMLPNQIVWLWFEFGSGQSSPYLKALLTLGSSMVYLNSSVNPVLYAGMNEEFRSGFLRLLSCRGTRGNFI